MGMGMGRRIQWRLTGLTRTIHDDRDRFTEANVH